MMLELFREKIPFNAIFTIQSFLPSPARPFMDSELQKLSRSDPAWLFCQKHEQMNM